jgi:Carboxypeptidase regulatory-like domain
MKAAFLFLLVISASAQERNGSIIGTVSDSVSHQPLRKVTVSLALGNGPPVPDASTDDAGAFAFHDLKPGQYQLSAGRRDYPGGKTITVGPSENPDPIKIELIPGAIVSGRILDEDGDPLYGCGVQARRAEHPEQIIAQSAGEPGEYRLFGLQAGKYVLAAQCPVPVFQPRPFSAGPDPPPSLAYPLEFYPAALGAASAETD